MKDFSKAVTNLSPAQLDSLAQRFIERAKQRAAVQATVKERPRERGEIREARLEEIFADCAQRYAEATAVICDGEVLSYGELDRRTTRLAWLLRQQGVREESRVGLLLGRSIASVVAILGVLKAGAAYLPLDRQAPPLRLKKMLRDAECELVLSTTADASLLEDGEAAEEWRGKVLCLDQLEEELAAAPVESLPRNAGGGDSLAYVMYTSGSTGPAKGVMVTHRNVSRLVCGTDYARFGPQETFLLLAPLGFDASTFELWGALLNGGRLAVLASERPTLDELERALTEHGVTTLWLSAGLFHLVCEERLECLRGLRQLLAGGDVLDPKQVERASTLLKARGGVVINGYGPTETTTFACCHRISEWKTEQVTGRVPIGKPIAEAHVYVLDDGQELAGKGMVGELHIGGGGVGRGYLNHPALTAERFVPHAFDRAGERVYRSGDLVRWRANGVLEFLGRLDGQVKVRGFRVEPGEVESVLREHAQVKDAVVVVNGAGAEKRLAAYVVWVGDEKESATAELRSHVRRRLPEYMWPGAIVLLEALPLTPNGKVDRRALPTPVEEESAAYLAPRTPVEELLAGIWSEVLGRERVGISENFFELGGHSLLATKAVARVQEVCGVNVSLRYLFEFPTIELFATRVEESLKMSAETEEPLTKADRSGPLPLSFAQQRLWFIDQLKPGDSIYNLPAAIRLSGPINIPALQRALTEVVRRHESLRTRIVVSNGEPVQVIDPPAAVKLKVIDLTHMNEEARQAEMWRKADLDAAYPFDLSQGPLIRARLLRMADEDHLLLVNMHHVISDGWSVGLFVREMTALYEAFSLDRPSPLEELVVQYADFAVWQRRRLDGPAIESQLSYWRKQLSDLPPLIELPIARPRPPIQTYNGAIERTVLPAGVSSEVQRLCRAERATLFMVLLAAFKVVLARYTGQSDVWVGSPVSNRTRVRTESLIGFFVNTLVLRTDLSGNPSFKEVLERVRRTCLEAYTHQELPFDRIVEELQPNRDLSRSPLFQIMFAFHDSRIVNLSEVAGLKVQVVERPRTRSTFDLTFTVLLEGEQLGVSVEYNTDLFERNAIQDLSQRWSRVLPEAVRHPEVPIASLAWLDESERQRLLVEYSGTAVATATEQSLTQRELVPAMVARRAQLRPDGVAVETVEESDVPFSNGTLTYRELVTRSRFLGQHLRQLGVGPETPVAVLCDRGLELPIAALAVWQAGGVYVPLDAAHPGRRLEWILEDAGVRVLLLGSGTTAPGGYRDQVVHLDEVLKEHREFEALDQNTPVLSPDSVAYIIYTSGSTGQPKGVMVTHGGLANYVTRLADVIDLRPADRLLQFASPSFDASLEEMFGALASGATVVPRSVAMIDSSRWFLEECARLRITVLDLPTAYLHELIGGTVVDDWQVCPSLRLTYFGGERVHEERAAAWHRLTGGTIRFVNAYGPTEATIVATCAELNTRDLEGGRVPIGRPIPGVTAHVLDSALQPVPAGLPGQLYLGGVGLARGYLNRPDLTASAFIPNPHGPSSGARLYDTGDRAAWREGGLLDYCGRTDDQIKIRGYRVELDEIGAQILAHPSVRDVVVLAIEIAPGETRLVAYLEPEKAAADTTSGAQELVPAVRDYLRERLPDYMVPAAFMVVDQLPQSSSAKIDRQALPEPDFSQSEIGRQQSPRTPVEETIASIWREVLGLEQVGIRSNFFDLGGHSLLATRAMSRIKEALNVDVPLRLLFESPTIEDLSLAVEQVLASDRKPLPPIVKTSRAGDLPLSFAQQRLWLLQQMDPASGTLNIPAGLRLTGRLDLAVLEQSLTEVARRHESLRTSFPLRNGMPFQQVNLPAAVQLDVTDLTGLAKAGAESEVIRALDEESERPFDLEHGPLWRSRVLQLGEEEHVLLYTMHHTISDEWSAGVLMQEVATLYGAFVSGKETSLPELNIQYSDYAVWQRDLVQGEFLEEQINYWRQQLAGAPATLDLPTDKPRTALTTTKGGQVKFRVPAELTLSLKDLSKQEHATLFMTLLAAFKVLLHRKTRQLDIVVGTPIAGRGHRELEGLIGAFINALALRVDLSGDPTFRQIIHRVQAAVLGAFAHQDMPFEKLIEVLQPSRRTGQTPLFQVVFNYQQPFAPAGNLSDLKISFLEQKLEKAKYDLTLYIGEVRGELSGTVTYKTDLFEQSRIERIVKDFERILSETTANPDLQLSAISVSETARVEDRPVLDRSEPVGLAKVRRKAIKLSPEVLVQKSYLQADQTFPLVMQPSMDQLDLAGWALNNNELVEEELLKYGAILFRGFNVASVEKFREFAATITPELVNYIEGSSVRVLLGNQVYTSTEYPADYFVSLHNELSYAHRWPGKLLFCCLEPPERGGETPIADSRKVFQLIDLLIKERFISRGVKYLRNLHGGNGAGLSWQMVFETDDRKFVETYCREGEIEFEWQSNGGLRTSQIRPAVAQHPRTGETVWFNQADQWHPSNLVSKLATGLDVAGSDQTLPINACYGDGSPFDDLTLDQVRKAYRQATVMFAWQRGDVLLLDNMLTAHGRMPYSGKRRIAVAMGAPVTLKEVELVRAAQS